MKPVTQGVSEMFLKRPHRRFNPLKREWVLVSPNRTQRPWQGQVAKHTEMGSRFPPS
jgi:UDPglucose--hexose-1-phosphate uridylyltransferase